MARNFNPRFPRGKRHPGSILSIRCLSISIHASRGGSDLLYKSVFRGMYISIHASRGGSDNTTDAHRVMYCAISIHASRGGSDAGDTLNGLKEGIKFQSTLPAGEATDSFHGSLFSEAAFQSTLPAGEATTSASGQAS